MIQKRFNSINKPVMKSISIKNIILDEKTLAVMAGPCSIESFEQFQSIVQFLKTQGVSIVRGGIFKHRTNFRDFQGLGEKALPIVKELKKQEDFLFITEITDVRQIDSLMSVADIFQVGARSMYNYELLKELGKVNRPILLKRGFSAHIKEWLSASEYISKGGNDRVILCERGIRTFETSYRNTLDINAVIYLRQKTSFPVFVDPSHATGDSSMVAPSALASVTAGACGLLVEVHNEPEKALSDGFQSLNFDQFAMLMKKLKPLAQMINKQIV